MEQFVQNILGYLVQQKSTMCSSSREFQLKQVKLTNETNDRLRP